MKEVECKSTNVNVVATLFHDVGDGAASARVEHDLVLVDKRVLEHAAKDVSSRNVVTDLKPSGR
jgi:hypothetical protein